MFNCTLLCSCARGEYLVVIYITCMIHFKEIKVIYIDVYGASFKQLPLKVEESLVDKLK